MKTLLPLDMSLVNTHRLPLKCKFNFDMFCCLHNYLRFSESTHNKRSIRGLPLISKYRTPNAKYGKYLPTLCADRELQSYHMGKQIFIKAAIMLLLRKGKCVSCVGAFVSSVKVQRIGLYRIYSSSILLGWWWGQKQQYGNIFIFGLNRQC